MATEVPSEPVKRSSNRRSKLQCRLCLQIYPKTQLADIFDRGSDWQNHIQQAVSVTAAKTDHSTQLCAVCQMMISVIVAFQRICQRTDVLLSEGRSINRASWKDAIAVTEALYKIVTRYDNEVFSELEDPFVETEVESERLNTVENIPSDVEERDFESANDEPKQPSDCEQLELSGTEECAAEITAPIVPKQRAKKRSNKLAEKVVCDTCGQLVSHQSLEGHMNRHRGVKPFVCELEGCGRQLYSKYSLQQHRHLHKSINRFYDCQHCGKRIKGTNSWLRHKKLHTEQPKFSCDVCGKTFRRRFYLKVHSVVHTGVAIHACEICGKHFTIKHNLGAHYKMHARKGLFPEGKDKRTEEDNAEIQPVSLS